MTSDPFVLLAQDARFARSMYLSRCQELTDMQHVRHTRAQFDLALSNLTQAFEQVRERNARVRAYWRHLGY